MNKITDCITTDPSDLVEDKKPVLGRIHSFESCALLMAQVLGLSSSSKAA